MDRPLSSKKRSQQKLKFWLKSFLLILIAIAILRSVQWVLSPSIDRDKLRTSIVSAQDLVVTINSAGLVLPLSEETITSELNSHVSRVFVELGQRVNEGDSLVQLDTQKISLEIDNTLEKIALKDSQINTKKLNMSKSLNDLSSQLELLAVDLESRSTKKLKLAQLETVGAFSSQDLLEAELNVKRTNIEMRQLRQAMQDIRSTTEAEVTTLALEKNILLKALSEQKRLAQAALVTASRSGVVSWLNQDEGSSVIAGQSLVKIIDDSAFKIEASLSDFYASQLVPNMRAEIRYQDNIVYGKLTQQTPSIENGLMKLSITLDEPSNSLLKHNLRVDVGLITNTVNDALTLNKGAYVSGRGVHDVFVLKDGLAQKTKIEIGHSSTLLHEIKMGLKENDEVIISDMSDYLHLNQFTVN